MRILEKNQKGFIRLTPESQEDLWLLSTIISPGATVKAKTTRKVKLSETKVEKKTITMMITVVSTSFEDTLRISGTVISEHEDIPKGSAHSFSIHGNDQLSIMQHWHSFQIKRLDKAAQPQFIILMVALDRESVYFSQLHGNGYKILSHFDGDVQKKGVDEISKSSFYDTIAKTIEEYILRFDPSRIIIASPAFFKEDFMKHASDNIKNKAILATCSSVGENAFTELLKRDEVKTAIAQSKADDDMALVDVLFERISKQGNCTYGFEHVKTAVDAGAVESLLVSSAYLLGSRKENATITYNTLENIFTLVEQSRGSIHIVDSETDAGRRLDGIAGLAALLRYKV
jgi:protein pelota